METLVFALIALVVVLVCVAIAKFDGLKKAIETKQHRATLYHDLPCGRYETICVSGEGTYGNLCGVIAIIRNEYEPNHLIIAGFYGTGNPPAKFEIKPASSGLKNFKDIIPLVEIPFWIEK